jgi:CRP-like cAMP-binding protein
MEKKIVKLNKLLAALPEAEFDRFSPHFQCVELVFNETLFLAGEPIDCVYFPQRGLLSLLAISEEGNNAEVASVGCEGMVGFQTAGTRAVFPYQVRVQVEGEAVRIQGDAFRKEIMHHGALCAQVVDYLHPFIFQLSQNGLCNRFHNAEARLCRYLLTLSDYSSASELAVTQEFMAQVLGVHRNAVSVVYQKLQAENVIRYFRASLKILDRSSLEKSACECYRLIKSINTAVYPENPITDL